MVSLSMWWVGWGDERAKLKNLALAQHAHEVVVPEFSFLNPRWHLAVGAWAGRKERAWRVRMEQRA
eukprot:5777205-Prymnesium_polylepis.2